MLSQISPTGKALRRGATLTDGLIPDGCKYYVANRVSVGLRLATLIKFV